MLEESVAVLENQIKMKDNKYKEFEKEMDKNEEEIRRLRDTI